MITTIALGRLVAPPELTHTPSGKAVCKFRIACNRGAYDGTDFITVETWRGAEENAKRLVQGQQVQVTGKLRTSEWETDQGEKRSRMFINADDITWLAKPKGAHEDAPAETATAAA